MAAFGILRGARRACGSGRAGSARLFRAPATYAAAPDTGSAGGAQPGESRSSRVPSAVVRGTFAGVHVAYTVTHGDDERGYPSMTVTEMCDALEKRYKAKRPPAERHIHQLIDKVTSAEDARLAANAIARFRAERAFLAAGDDKWGLASASRRCETDDSRDARGKRGGLHPKSLLMFIEKCRVSGNVAAAVDAASKRHVMGFKVSGTACERLLELCETTEQVLRVYDVFRECGFVVDDKFATAVVAAAARCGDVRSAKAWLEEFEKAHVRIDAAGIDLDGNAEENASRGAEGEVPEHSDDEEKGEEGEERAKAV